MFCFPCSSPDLGLIPFDFYCCLSCHFGWGWGVDLLAHGSHLLWKPEMKRQLGTRSLTAM